MIALFEKLLPVLIIVFIGLLMRKKKLVSASAINELKQIIVNVALPCILFLSFGRTTLDAKYIVVVVMVKDNEQERYFFSQTVIYYTIISFAGYVLLMLI